MSLERLNEIMRLPRFADMEMEEIIVDLYDHQSYTRLTAERDAARAKCKLTTEQVADALIRLDDRAQRLRTMETEIGRLRVVLVETETERIAEHAAHTVTRLERDTARADRQALVEETRRKALEDAARTVCHNCASRGLAQPIEGMGFYHTGISIQEDGWCRSEKILRLLAQRPAEGGGKGEG